MQLRERIRRRDGQLRRVDAVHRERHFVGFGAFLRPGDDDGLEEVDVVPERQVNRLLPGRQRDRLAVRLEPNRTDAHDDLLGAHARARDIQRVLSGRAGDHTDAQLFDDDVRAGNRLTTIGSDGATDHGILRPGRTRAGNQQRQRGDHGEEQATTIVGHWDILS